MVLPSFTCHLLHDHNRIFFLLPTGLFSFAAFEKRSWGLSVGTAVRPPPRLPAGERRRRNWMRTDDDDDDDDGGAAGRIMHQVSIISLANSYILLRWNCVTNPSHERRPMRGILLLKQNLTHRRKSAPQRRSCTVWWGDMLHY